MGIVERLKAHLKGKIMNKEVKKDKHCIGCKHFFTCKGKPHRNPCVNKERYEQEIKK